MVKTSRDLFRDLALIFFSLWLAVILVQSGLLSQLSFVSQPAKFFGRFLAGMFFVSVFSVVPAAALLLEIARSTSPWLVAFWGGLGALVGDWLIFIFVRDRFSEHLLTFFRRKNPFQRLQSILRLRLFRWFLPLVGALIVASPFPDEIGLSLLGLSKMKTIVFIPLSFSLNFFGILIVLLLAQQLA